MLDADLAVVLEAQAIVLRAEWRLRINAALAGIGKTRGLARAPVFPGSEGIQVVAYRGKELGCIHQKRSGPLCDEAHWVAVPAAGGAAMGPYFDPDTAAAAFLRHR
jgi:hypothetical protein